MALVRREVGVSERSSSGFRCCLQYVDMLLEDRLRWRELRAECIAVGVYNIKSFNYVCEGYSYNMLLQIQGEGYTATLIIAQLYQFPNSLENSLMSERMLQRDYYLADYSVRYHWPAWGARDYLFRVTTLPISCRYLFSSQQLKPLLRHLKTNQSIWIGALTTAISVSLFYRLIPGLKAHTRTKRVLITLGMFVGAFGLHSYLSQKNTQRLYQVFVKKEQQWKQYKLTGDARIFNQQLKLEDIPDGKQIKEEKQDNEKGKGGKQ